MGKRGEEGGGGMRPTGLYSILIFIFYLNKNRPLVRCIGQYNFKEEPDFITSEIRNTR